MARNEAPKQDRRIRKTRSLLHEALASLIREKDYDAISVQDILERADVGRSTFYVHFANKDGLLASNLRDMLDAAIRMPGRPVPPQGCEGIVRFSLPIFEHIRGHRGTTDIPLGTKGRAVLHENLEAILIELVIDDVKRYLPRRGKTQVSPALLARHVASTFVLVLDWWLESRSPLSPAQIDEVFRALVLPALRAARASC